MLGRIMMPNEWAWNLDRHEQKQESEHSGPPVEASLVLKVASFEISRYKNFSPSEQQSASCLISSVTRLGS